jgi:hypothetical protein
VSLKRRMREVRHEVDGVRSRGIGIELNCPDSLEPRGIKTKRQTTTASKQVERARGTSPKDSRVLRCNDFRLQGCEMGLRHLPMSVGIRVARVVSVRKRSHHCAAPLFKNPGV